jgi:hypothetical protein
MRIAYEGDAAGQGAPNGSDAREEKKRQFLEAMKKKREQHAAAQQPGVKVFKPAVATGRARIPPALEEGTGAFAGINEFIAELPTNYTFEVRKCVNRILETKAKVVALQMPGGGKGVLSFGKICAHAFVCRGPTYVRVSDCGHS